MNARTSSSPEPRSASRCAGVSDSDARRQLRVRIDRLEQRYRRHVIDIVTRIRAGLGQAERARRVDVGEHPHAHRTRLLDQLDRARGREIALGLG